MNMWIWAYVYKLHIYMYLLTSDHYFVLFHLQFFLFFAGVRTPMSVDDIKVDLPHVYADLMTIQKQLEKHYRDMQDIEFTGDKYLHMYLSICTYVCMYIYMYIYILIRNITTIYLIFFHSVENGKLYILQTRTGKRTARAR
jgi:phosphoenolpyruvate synthase/pyruvate phosphate dikinase